MGVSTKMFEQGLKERYAAILPLVHRVASDFTVNQDRDFRITSVEELESSCKQLAGYMPSNHLPTWLQLLLKHIESYKSRRDAQAAGEFIKQLWAVYPSIRPIAADDFTTTEVDFDALYVQYRDDGSLAILFDRLIDIVGKIIDSNAVESVKALRALEKLLELLRSNRDGSFAATKWTIFSLRYLGNFVKECIREVPVLKQGMTAYENTLDEIENEFNKTQTSLQGAIEEKLMLSVKPPMLISAKTFEDVSLELPDPNTVEGELITEPPGQCD